MEIKIRELLNKLIKLSGYKLIITLRACEKVHLAGYAGKISTMLINYEALEGADKNLITNIICHELGHAISHQILGTNCDEFKRAAQFTKDEALADKYGEAIYNKLNLSTPYYAPSRDVIRSKVKEKLYQSFLNGDDETMQVYIEQLKGMEIKQAA